MAAKTAKKSTAKKSAAKKSAPKKSAARKSAPKKSAARKSAPKKSAARKSAPKKSAPKKATARKSAAKKSAAPKSAAKKSTPKSAAKKNGKQVPFVDYLVLGDRPYLRAQECKSCGARYFDRRNACASCFGTEFKNVRVKNQGEVTSFSIVAMGPRPFVSAIVDCDGTSVRCSLVGVEPDPDKLALGMKVKLATYSMGTDADGTEAIAFGFAPV